MASYTFNLPDIGEGIAEAEIVEWHVKIGDMIEEDARIADMMTDKATVEMESPVSGRVIAVAGEVGDVIAIGSMLVEIEVVGEGSDSEIAPSISGLLPAQEHIALSANSAPAKAGAQGGTEQLPLVSETVAPPTSLPPTPALPPEGGRDKVLASPAVRQRAKELGVDLAQVKSHGGHIRHADLDAFLNYGAAQGYRPAGAGATRPDEAIKVIGMRRRIAENMAAAKRHIPHFSYVEEFDVTDLEQVRSDLNQNRGDRPKLTFLPLMILAVCRAVPKFPMINARYDDEAGVVTRYGAVHLGMATQTDAGLMVPVIRNAQSLNVWQLASEINRLAEAARTGSAKSEELSGSTLTLTSLGPLGGIATTPVINRPEVAIIGPNKIVERPVVRDGEFGIAKLMNLSISCDHRVVDGWDAASFVQELKRLVETPVLLFQD